LIPNSVNGSQLLLCLIAVKRLQIISDITLHLYGPGAPPKVSRRLIIANSSSGNCVAALNVVSLWRWRRRYADLKSSFFAMIRLLGYFLQAATAQLISLDRHFPNLHCWSWEVSVWEFMLEPDFSHSKLDHGSICPSRLSLLVHLSSIAVGYSKKPCKCLEFS